MILTLIMLAAIQAKPCGDVHSYACHEPLVTVATLTAEELKAIADADAEARAAQIRATETRNRIIKAHGGFVKEGCPFNQGCMMISGERLSDEVEWKGNYLILTKKWLPEL